MTRPPIEEVSRQPLIRGTTCFTTPDGNTGFKTEDIQVSALVRIAAALEANANALTLLECGELVNLIQAFTKEYTKLGETYDSDFAHNMLRLCELTAKLLGQSSLSALKGGAANGG